MTHDVSNASPDLFDPSTFDKLDKTAKCSNGICHKTKIVRGRLLTGQYYSP